MRIEKKVALGNPWTNTDVVCEFQHSRFRRFRENRKNVDFRAKKVDFRENIAKIGKKLPEIILGPTQILCVNFSPISSGVLD